MKTRTTPAAASAALFLSRRVAAVRAELSETEALAVAGRPGYRAAAKALRRDLVQLESRLAEVV